MFLNSLENTVYPFFRASTVYYAGSVIFWYVQSWVTIRMEEKRKSLEIKKPGCKRGEKKLLVSSPTVAAKRSVRNAERKACSGLKKKQNTRLGLPFSQLWPKRDWETSCGASNTKCLSKNWCPWIEFPKHGRKITSQIPAFWQELARCGAGISAFSVKSCIILLPHLSVSSVCCFSEPSSFSY